MKTKLIPALAALAFALGMPTLENVARAATSAVAQGLTPVERTRCPAIRRVRPKLFRAHDALVGALGDFLPTDSEYPKLKEAIRQIDDADRTVEDRFVKNNCAV